MAYISRTTFAQERQKLRKALLKAQNAVLIAHDLTLKQEPGTATDIRNELGSMVAKMGDLIYTIERRQAREVV